MFELMIPTIPDVIKEIVKRESGDDVIVKFEANGDDCQIYVNPETCNRYLVQTSMKFDLFGFMSFKETYTVADVSVFIYMGPMFVFVYFKDKLVMDFQTMIEEWDCSKFPELDQKHKWASALLLFNRIGGIIYNYKDWTLVDKEMK